MKMESVFPRLRGKVTLAQVSGESWKDVSRGSNLVTYSGYDLMAAALAGTQRINGIYFAFTNDAALLPVLPPSLGRTAADYHTIGSTGKLGIVRVPLLADPMVLAGADNHFVANLLSLAGIAATQVLIPSGQNEVTDGTSLFYGAALAYLDPQDYRNDRLFSAYAFSTDTALSGGVLPKIAGANVALRWTVAVSNT